MGNVVDKILEVCKFRFGSISIVVVAFFPRIVTKIRIQLKLMSADFVLGFH